MHPDRIPPPIILLTATITPPVGAPQLQRSDPSLREQDYIEALQYYLQLLSERVIGSLVFCDNSLSSLEAMQRLDLAKAAGTDLEFISFNGLDYPVEYGRGFGEFKLIQHAMATSKLLLDASEETPIFKVTGRYTVRNLVQVLAACSSRDSFWVHCRNYPIRWADMYLVGWKKEYYRKHLQEIHHRFSDQAKGISAEVSFRAVVDELAAHGGVSRRFRPSPILGGARGLDNAPYEQQGFKLLTRSLADQFLPGLWI